MRFTLTLVLFCIFHFGTLSQITMKVVSPATTEKNVDSFDLPIVIEELLDSAGFSVMPGGTRSQLPLRQIFYDNIFFSVKRYSKLKTFEIIIHKNYSNFSRNNWHKKHSEIKHLKKHRWIYEGDSISQNYALLDSISDQCWYTQRLPVNFRKRSRRRGFPGTYLASPSPYLRDFYLEENTDSDNFILNIELFSGEKIQIPLGILTESTNAKKIQQLYSGFYKLYNRDLKKRKNSWSTIEESYAEYLEDYLENGWTEEEIKRSSFNNRGALSFLRTQSQRTRPLIANYFKSDSLGLKPSTIYVVNYTYKTVYVFSDILSAFYFHLNNTAIMVIDENNQLGVLNKSDFQTSQVKAKKRSLYFEMNYSANEFLYDLIELAKL